jgi:hypothetical protein
MIRIAITQAAFDAIAATLPLGTVAYEADRTDRGEVHIWLEEHLMPTRNAVARPMPADERHIQTNSGSK